MSSSTSTAVKLERISVDVAGPVVRIALHHPPFWTGIGHMDRMGLANPGASPTSRLVVSMKLVTWM